MIISNAYKLYVSPNRKFVRALKNLLGFVPGNTHLYAMAFRHKSVATTIKKGTKNSNERLEFLGDAILGAVIAEQLFKLYPYRGEGFLTEMRSKIVSRASLNQLALKLGFNELLRYDPKMVTHYGKSPSLLGDAFEALIGAVYLDRGYEKTKSFILNRIVKNHVDVHLLERTETNFKSRLIEWCQSENKAIAFEQVENADGESTKLFTVNVLIDGQIQGIGRDYNKKNAEKLAAEKACEILQVI